MEWVKFYNWIREDERSVALMNLMGWSEIETDGFLINFLLNAIDYSDVRWTFGLSRYSLPAMCKRALRGAAYDPIAVASAMIMSGWVTDDKQIYEWDDFVRGLNLSMISKDINKYPDEYPDITTPDGKTRKIKPSEWYDTRRKAGLPFHRKQTTESCAT
jgi:hypothetical protein